MAKKGIKNLAKDIQGMDRKELMKYFCFKNRRKVNVKILIRNIIWQTYSFIKQGKMGLIDGNIRSFWYRSIKPVLSKLGFKLSGTKYTEKVYDTFVEMVTKEKLFKYADFGFLDERSHARAIGKTNGNLILFVEKEGLFGLAKKMALEHDITVIALGGFPSYLTTEFLMNDLGKLGILRKPLRLFSIVDYDPSGYWIEQEFVQQFKDFGAKVTGVCSLVNPKELPSELLETCKYKLKKGSKTDNWLKATGGIAGESFGLEADAFGYEKIKEAYEKAVLPYLKAVPKTTVSKIAIKQCPYCGAKIQ